MKFLSLNPFSQTGNFHYGQSEKLKLIYSGEIKFVNQFGYDKRTMINMIILI